MAWSSRRNRGASSLPIAGPKKGVANMVRAGAAGLQTRGTTRAVMRPYGCIVVVIYEMWFCLVLAGIAVEDF